jgi:hypothetical protein
MGSFVYDRVKRDGVGDTLARVGEMRNTNKSLVGNTKRPLGRKRCEDVNWIYLAQDRTQWQTVLNTMLNVRAS